MTLQEFHRELLAIMRDISNGLPDSFIYYKIRSRIDKLCTHIDHLELKNNEDKNGKP